jgi:hypothetical protein
MTQKIAVGLIAADFSGKLSESGFIGLVDYMIL